MKKKPKLRILTRHMLKKKPHIYFYSLVMIVLLANNIDDAF